MKFVQTMLDARADPVLCWHLDEVDGRADGLLLRFLRMDDLTYPQFKHPFVPSLSIIDVLMFNSREEVKELLQRFSVVEGQEKRATLTLA